MWVIVTLGAALGILASGCSAAPSQPPPPTYELPPETVRPDEVALRLPPVTDDEAVFALIGLTTGQASIAGSHAEWPAKGQFTRVRVVVTNSGRSNLIFDTGRQQLITADGVAHAPDQQAMTIKRQPGKFELGSNVRIEFDLYYDLPKDQRPVTLRVFGGGSPQDQDDTIGTDIPLDGRSAPHPATPTTRSPTASPTAASRRPRRRQRLGQLTL